MVWTFSEIQREWFGDGELGSRWDPTEVEQALARAERLRGTEWVLGEEFDLTGIEAPGVGRRGGWGHFLRSYSLGQRLQSLEGAVGTDGLLRRLLADDPAADSELTAVHLVRDGGAALELEIEPVVPIGGRERRTDFRVRRAGETWTFVEVTQLRRSGPSDRVTGLLHRLATAVMANPRPFLLEIVLWREPTDLEEAELISRALIACSAAAGSRTDVGDLASLLVKAGDSRVVEPSVLSEADGQPRMAVMMSSFGPGDPGRQVLARVPFADARAEAILTLKARQLPANECGLVMVDVGNQPSAFEGWAELVPSRFSRTVHTRVAGVILFQRATYPTAAGPVAALFVRLFQNPYARVPLPAWIVDAVDRKRAEARELKGGPD